MGKKLRKSERKKGVIFFDRATAAAFEDLKKGRHEEKRLANSLEQAINDLMQNPLKGVKVPSRLWPKEYLKKYNINNLRKYDLPDGWRLLYTIHGNKIEILAVILEWLAHKDYERKFGYKPS